jgi:hypothetical protein
VPRQLTAPLMATGRIAASLGGSGTADYSFPSRIGPRGHVARNRNATASGSRSRGGERGWSREIQKMLGTDSGIASVNGSGAWAEWGRRGGSPGPFGLLLRRDRDPGRPRASVSRPHQMGKLMLVPVGLWPVRVHPITNSNNPEAGDGPPPVPGGTAS